MPVFNSVRTVVLLGACLLAHVVLQADDWPEWRGAGRTGVWNETGILDTFPAGGLTVRWRTPIHAGYAGPSVSAGRVFLTDSRRTVGNRAIERALAIDEQTGAVLWTQEWPADYTGLQLIYAIGPRATPTVDGDPRLRARRDGPAAGARCRHRTHPLAEGLRARLRRVGAVVGHVGGAAGRRRSADRARRRRAQRESDCVQQAHRRGSCGGRCRPIGSPATTSRPSSRMPACGS